MAQKSLKEILQADPKKAAEFSAISKKRGLSKEDRRDAAHSLVEREAIDVESQGHTLHDDLYDHPDFPNIKEAKANAKAKIPDDSEFEEPKEETSIPLGTNVPKWASAGKTQARSASRSAQALRDIGDDSSGLEVAALDEEIASENPDADVEGALDYARQSRRRYPKPHRSRALSPEERILDRSFTPTKQALARERSGQEVTAATPGSNMPHINEVLKFANQSVEPDKEGTEDHPEGWKVEHGTKYLSTALHYFDLPTTATPKTSQSGKITGVTNDQKNGLRQAISNLSMVHGPVHNAPCVTGNCPNRTSSIECPSCQGQRVENEQRGIEAEKERRSQREPEELAEAPVAVKSESRADRALKLKSGEAFGSLDEAKASHADALEKETQAEKELQGAMAHRATLEPSGRVSTTHFQADGTPHDAASLKTLEKKIRNRRDNHRRNRLAIEAHLTGTASRALSDTGGEQGESTAAEETTRGTSSPVKFVKIAGEPVSSPSPISIQNIETGRSQRRAPINVPKPSTAEQDVFADPSGVRTLVESGEGNARGELLTPVSPKTMRGGLSRRRTADPEPGVGIQRTPLRMSTFMRDPQRAPVASHLASMALGTRTHDEAGNHLPNNPLHQTIGKMAEHMSGKGYKLIDDVFGHPDHQE